LIKEATSGKPFDVSVVPVEVMRDASARSNFAAGPTLDIARLGLGVAVRAGAPKPNISTPDALKAALLNAESVASIPDSATGYSIAKVFERLGITEQMKAKMKAQPTPAQVVALVAKGEAELALFLMNVLTGASMWLAHSLLTCSRMSYSRPRSVRARRKPQPRRRSSIT
jgi:molybdate transport system substrate-binding protein